MKFTLVVIVASVLIAVVTHNPDVLLMGALLLGVVLGMTAIKG